VNIFSVFTGVALTSIALAAPVARSCGDSDRLKTEPAGVVLITLDTTRADYLSAYGFMDVSMPHLDRLGREGVIFDQASSVAPLTLPAHTSLFTGLFPPRHGVRTNGDEPLAARHTTLAELLREQGFRTAAFVGSTVLDANRGLSQGFERYGAVPPNDDPTAAPGQRRADGVVTDAIRWLDCVSGSRFFLWTHLYDPHRPYDPPEPFRSLYAGSPYLGEIAFADAQIGRLLAALERYRVLDRTIVVVAGDHGESLGDHDERDHGIFVYESVLRVPLIIRAPALPPRRVATVVRLVDVMPTILDMLDLAAPAIDGRSLVGVMTRDGPHPDRDAYAESVYPRLLGWSPLRSLRAGRFKLIEAPRPELYDLLLDPFEKRNLHDQRRTLAASLESRLAALAGRDGLSRGKAAFVPAELQRRLAALGYIASAREPGSSEAALPDPKDCIAVRKARGSRSVGARAPGRCD